MNAQVHEAVTKVSEHLLAFASQDYDGEGLYRAIVDNDLQPNYVVICEPSQWDFSTNGVASANNLGIPTIGFGAGLEKMAHMTDEYCPVADISAACQFYALLPYYLGQRAYG